LTLLRCRLGEFGGDVEAAEFDGEVEAVGVVGCQLKGFGFHVLPFEEASNLCLLVIGNGEFEGGFVFASQDLLSRISVLFSFTMW
jgi:hypothetical protein